MAKTNTNTNTTSKVNTKATAPATTPAMSTKDFNSLFPATQGLVGTHVSIYKKELFEGVTTEKEKKSRRRKLRNQRDNFLGSYLEARKNEEKLKALRKEWKEYASKVYVNINLIFESNTSADTQAICKEFTKAMEG